MIGFLVRYAASMLIVAVILYPVGVFTWLDIAWWGAAGRGYRHGMAVAWMILSFLWAMAWQMVIDTNGEGCSHD